MIKMRGRKAKMTMLDGELVEVRSLLKFHNSLAITIPKMWIEVAKMNGEFTELAVQQKDNVLIIRPFYTKKTDNGEVE